MADTFSYDSCHVGLCVSVFRIGVAKSLHVDKPLTFPTATSAEAQGEYICQRKQATDALLEPQ